MKMIHVSSTNTRKMKKLKKNSMKTSKVARDKKLSNQFSEVSTKFILLEAVNKDLASTA